MEVDDSVLWSRARMGDSEAFGMLFERHAWAIYNFCFRRVGNWATAEDLLSATTKRLREVADRVLWLEDGQLRTLEALVRDPVCGMLLDPAQAHARLERDGETIYFCSRGCRTEFPAATGEAARAWSG